MNRIWGWASLPLLTAVLFLISTVCLAQTQQSASDSGAPAAATAASPVPQLVRYTGVAKDVSGRPMSGVLGITFALYSAQTGGAPLWLETQSVQADSNGHYSVQLGATQAEGLPNNLFASGEARWLGVEISGQAEQPRVLLLSVPYALKAGDAATVGGLPPSAFMLAAPAAATGTGAGSTATAGALPPASVSGSGTTDYIPLWTSSSALGDSLLFQTGSGSTGRIGINTLTPAATLDVNGGLTVRGLLNLPAAANATASVGANSRPFDLVGSTYNSTTSSASNQVFRWMAEPIGNGTPSPSATLNLLFGTAPAAPAETGLHISSNGLISFATGQTFPGTGAGTITGVTAGIDLTGGGTTGTVTLNVDTTKVPQLGAPNTFVGNQAVTGNLTASGEVQGGVVNATTSFDIGGTAFDFGSTSLGNSFLGFAGNSTMSGNENVGVGYQTLGADTSGNENTGVGFRALWKDTTGLFNTGVGGGALLSNTAGSDDTAVGTSAAEYTTGSYNTAVGFGALISNGAGTLNTALGYYAGPSSAGLTNATAIGANAAVSESNAVVLGGTGSNAVSVGIGTATPAYTLDVHGTGNFSTGVNAYSSASGVSALFGDNSAASGTGTNGVYGETESPAGAGTVGVNFSSGGSGLYGQSNGTSSGSVGVYGTAVSTSVSGPTYGVYGSTSGGAEGSAGVYGVTNGNSGNTTYGVYGVNPDVSDHGTAVAGTESTVSSTGSAQVALGKLGVWGDNVGSIAGVLGTADVGTAMIAENSTGTTTDLPALFIANNSTTTGALALQAGNSVSNECTIDVDGNLVCSGTITTSAMGPSGSVVQLYGVASPENWFEDFGSGQLSGGTARVALDPAFVQTISANGEYHVFLTPKGDCEGLYVSGETASGFEVHELRGGRSSVEFDFRIVAKRRGYENVRLVDITSRIRQMHERAAQMVPKTTHGMTSAPQRPVVPQVTPVILSHERSAEMERR
jgi:hypothetical protein